MICSSEPLLIIRTLLGAVFEYVIFSAIAPLPGAGLQKPALLTSHGQLFVVQIL
jgi:hypothetical protein